MNSGGGNQWDCPANQCIRTLKGCLAIKTYAGNYIENEIPILSKQFRNELIPYFTSCDIKKFSGGRTAVQDTRIEELFYLPDHNKTMKIKDNSPSLSVEGKGITVTVFKKSEDEKSTVLRIINLSEEETTAKFQINGKIYLSDMSEEKETHLGTDRVQCSLSPKKIVTLKIRTVKER
jgi:hypothetical protein